MAWECDTYGRKAWLGHSKGTAQKLSPSSAARINDAVEGHLAARIANPPRALDDTAAALVKAYTAGGPAALDAALRLADHIFELHGGSAREGA